MMININFLQGLVKPGTQIQKTEVIKRYRSSRNFDQAVLRMICMMEFFMISKNDKGELSFS
jgi:hypothetical protein